MRDRLDSGELELGESSLTVGDRPKWLEESQFFSTVGALF